MAEVVVVVGQGYVGLPVAMAAVEAGYRVIGYDTSSTKVQALNRGESFVEDIPSAEVAAAIESGLYNAVTSMADVDGFDIAVISVPTPLREGTPDLSFIKLAARSLAHMVRPGNTVILESTTYPGTTEELVAPILEDGSGLKVGADFHLGYSPERIDPGNKTYTLKSTPKVVSGVDPASLAKVQAFYDSFVEQTVPVGDVKVAELTKLLENTFRHVNIALVNELAMFAHDLDIDVWEAIDAASTKPFGYMRFTPGPGVGGHCLPVDPSYLSWQVRQSLGRSFRFVELANDVNEHMPDYVIRRLMHTFNEKGLALKGRRVLLLGMAYKRNTGDSRESPSEKVAEGLLEMGAHVRAVDPHIDPRALPSGAVHAEFTVEEIRAADAVVVLVDHDAFDLDMVVQEAQFVFDCKHTVEGPVVEAL